ncbi:nucleoside-diphosphate sugar epimerase/dehydratase [Marispirochaeta aestuarii]|uniref:polysaccharide biosynthesis protein n=1 Tax=Marispirochaeta aestuarii TaxID=1963862 RepID=UPI0029C6A429|nr:nucleoside-diphosphate sugar epimerase/dehydratase [Marispirochaeta aestuarii]
MQKSGRTIYIVGAGFAGRKIAEEIKTKGTFGRLVAFLDDDPGKIGTKVDDIPVLGPIARISKIFETHPADEALIAIPGATNDQLTTIYEHLSSASFDRIRILPNLAQIIDGDAHLIQTREIAVEDLLGRTPVRIPLKETLSYLRDKRVLITGAGGSIGSELSRQLLSAGAERLYLFDNGENNVYEIEKELKILQEEGVGEKATLVPVVGDLKDREYTRFIIQRLKADIIFHCAAYKHVPMAESNPVEVIKNNVFGTLHLVEAVRESSVPRLVLISTDKAVEPRYVYGASKMISEELALARNNGNQHFMVVRFGNVLDSRGSIVPLFKKQILKGGPVTITDPRATRYFMTIPEAVSLVLKSGGLGTGGDLYVLDMGEPVPIQELAEQMIRFYGYEPGTDIPINYIGLRQGEKLSERLWAEGETGEATDFQRILRLRHRSRITGSLEDLIRDLKPVCFFDPLKPETFRDRRVLRSTLARHIPSFEVPDDEPRY